MPSQHFVFHLLPNAHLDPVWLWDWREGLNEGLVTVRTILNLMDEFPRLTFIRGEAAIYEHIEKTDRATFERIGRMIDAGRWDVVGGTYIQPDSNLASTETLCREFERGLKYFESRFGKRPTACWQADSFGHTPGWPNIARSFGMESFAFTRPQLSAFPMESPVFWWNTGSDSALLCYRQYWAAYCCERFNLIENLDRTLEGASRRPFQNVGLMMGLGNHGGGPSRRHVADVEEWAARHPEIEVRFSTLHGFFEALRCEIAPKDGPEVPAIRGDLGYCLRGCYSSVAKFKFPFRKAEALLAEAEATQALISSAFGTESAPLDEAWDAILFNAFHDIIPGTSIERAFEDQLAWVGMARHQALVAQLKALNQLAANVDTSVAPPEAPDRPTDVALLVWNPLPRPVKRWFELEASLDYRPFHGIPAGIGSLPLVLETANGKRPVFQEIAIESNRLHEMTWRKRVAVYDELPAFGWKVYQFGTRKEAQPLPAVASECTATCDAVASAEWRVALTSDGAVRIQHRGKDLFDEPGAMALRLVEDPWGSWGGSDNAPPSSLYNHVREEWKITRSEIIEPGPGRAALWTHWSGANSWLDLTFSVASEAPGVRVKGRLLMNERSARLKLVLPCSGSLVMDVPGSRAERNEEGQLPAGRWVARRNGARTLGFVSDVLGDVDVTANEMRITLARASRYADSTETAPDAAPWLPAVDVGELQFEFWLTDGDTDLRDLAEQLQHPPVALLALPHPGKLGRAGSLGAIAPSSVQLLAAETDSNGRVSLRVQNCGDSGVDATFNSGAVVFNLGFLKPWQISTVVLPGRPEPSSME